MGTLLEVLVIKCRGRKNSGVKGNKVDVDALEPKNAEEVILKIYGSGKTEPICRYLRYDECFASKERFKKDRASCPYRTTY